MSQSKIPAPLRAGIAALMILAGGGYAAYTQVDRETGAMLHHEYVQAVARDAGTSQAVKLAMVMGAYYESSYRHIGTPYVDKLGRGQPLTVCNGVTGAGVVAGRYYTPADCYQLERAKYLASERFLVRSLPAWTTYSVFAQATVLDFAHNKGLGAFESSTMRRKLVAGDVSGACRENPKWNRGTVNGVSTVLPGLRLRGEANAEICAWGES